VESRGVKKAYVEKDKVNGDDGVYLFLSGNGTFYLVGKLGSEFVFRDRKLNIDDFNAWTVPGGYVIRDGNFPVLFVLYSEGH